MKFLTLGAIDIGSNSIRLLITHVIPTPTYTYYKKVSITRLPVRLGADVFTQGEISKETGYRLVDAMRAFAAIMRVNGATDFRACATSAMREAKNSSRWIRRVRRASGIDIEVIDGEEEAKLVFQAKLFDRIHPEEPNLCFVDVGGGSTELTFFCEGKAMASRSFPLGTVRHLGESEEEKVWSDLRAWLDVEVSQLDGPVALVGAGGNINKAHKISGRPVEEPLSKQYLDRFSKQLESMTADERVLQLGLNMDRADVIVPALRIYRRVLRWTNATWVYVPKIGVSDGIIRELYHRKYRALWEQPLES
jgi:exopolyphosphatase / guanosine-5'-triphosphate,3'-diphosphate pyrophosphatase